MVPTLSEKPRTFISYAREDGGFALKLAKDLRNAGTPIWIDQLDIAAGAHWDDAVQEALNASPRVLVILSPTSVSSPNVKDEVRYALDQNKEVIPVLYRDCEIPFWLHRLQRIDVRADITLLLEVLGAQQSSSKRRIKQVQTVPTAGSVPPAAPIGEGGTKTTGNNRMSKVWIVVSTLILSLTFYSYFYIQFGRPPDHGTFLAVLLVLLLATTAAGSIFRRKPTERRNAKRMTWLIACLVLLGVRASGQPQEVICSPEKPVVVSGEVIRIIVRAAGENRSGNPKYKYEWRTTTGTLESQGRDAVWDSTGAPQGDVIVHVDVEVSNGLKRRCDARVYVASEAISRGPEEISRLTRSRLLVRGEPEPVGYGLYSYLLLSKAGINKTAQERNRRVLEVFLERLIPLANLGKGFSEEKLNIFFALASTPPSKPVDIDVDWLLVNYDYDAAQRILLKLKRPLQQCPSMVSSTLPIQTKGLSRQLLFQNISWITPTDAQDWVDEFVNQTAQERFWDGRTLPQLRLKLLTLASIIGAGYADMRDAVLESVKIINR